MRVILVRDTLKEQHNQARARDQPKHRLAIVQKIVIMVILTITITITITIILIGCAING